MTLQFDPARSTFLYDGAEIGPGTRPDMLEGVLGERAVSIPGQTGWTVLKTHDRPLNLSLSFRDDVAHSGFFWCAVAAAKSWDEAEAVERSRHDAHVAIMTRLFGAEKYQDDRIKVYLVRDPRSYLEEIFFELA